MSAVTLLALANGAGDVITAIISGSAPGGVSYNIGALYGAGLFVAAMVTAMVIIGNKDSKFIKFDKWIIYRDVGFYILSTLVIITFAVVGYINTIEAVVLLFIYVALVLFVIIKEKCDKKKADKEAEKAKASGSVQGQTAIGALFGSNAPKPQLTNGLLSDNTPKKEENNEVKPEVQEQNDGEEEQPDVENADEDDKLIEKVEPVIAEDNKEKKGALHTAFLQAFAKIADDTWFIRQKLRLMHEAKNKKWSERTCMEKIDCLLDAPMNAFCYCTALPVEHHEYDFKRVLIWPIPGIAFMIWIVTKFNYPWIYLEVGLPLVLIYYVCALLFLPKGEKAEKLNAQLESPKWYMVFTIQGVLAGLMYTYVLVGVLIDNLNTIGIALNLSTTYLGLTILAVGNALPDALTTISLAKDPKTVTMAISGGYAGQLFGLLVGFGLSMLKVTLMQGQQAFTIFNPADIKKNILDLMVIFTALVVLSFTFLWGVFNKFKMTKTFAWIMLGMYAAFFVSATIIAVIHAANTF